MTSNNTGTRRPQHDLSDELNFLSRALKAPTVRDVAGRLTGRAREEGWTHEEFLRACIGKSPRGKDMAANPGSAPPAFLPVNRWRSSTSTTLAVCSVMPPPI